MMGDHKGTIRTPGRAFVSSKLDHCNVLIYGLPKYQLNRLQFVLLPVYYRILFKVLLLVFNPLTA